MNARAAHLHALKTAAAMLSLGEKPGALTDGLSEADAVRVSRAWDALCAEMVARVRRLAGPDWNPADSAGKPSPLDP